MKDLTKGNILRLIITFALPIAIGNIFQLLYSLADTRIVGEFLGEEALAAVGSASSLNSMIIGFLMGMTNGFSIVAARYFGAKDEKGLKRSVAATFILGMGVAILLTLASVIFLMPLLRLLNTPEHIIDLAYRYFRIILWGMAGSMLYNICAGLFRAIGDTVTPLIFLVFSTLLNIGLDLLFVCSLGLGVEGAAYATVFSQFLAFICCIFYMVKKYPLLHFGREEMVLEKSMAKEMFSIGLSMGFMNSLINVGSVALQGAINSLKDADYIVAHTAARKITELFMLPFVFFGTAMATFAGQNLGARKPERIRKGLYQVILLTWGWCAVVVLMSYTVVPLFVQAVTATSQQKIIEIAALYLRVDTLLYFVTAVIIVLRNVMQGIGDSVTPIVSSGMELLCKVLVAIFLTPYLGYWAIILSEPVSWVVMVIPLLISARKNPVLCRERTQ